MALARPQPRADNRRSALAAVVERLPERTPPSTNVSAPGADAARGDDPLFLLRVLAHDLRNPLAALTNAAQLTRTASDPEVSARALAIVERECARLTHVVEDVVDLATLAAGPAELTLAALDARVVADAAVAAIAPGRTQRAQAMAIVRSPQPLPIRGDEERLTRSLVRLLERASAVTPRGGEVRLALEDDGMHAVLRVGDGGEALTDAAVRSLLAVPSARDHAAHGVSGASLPLVARVAALHDGRLTVSRASAGNELALSLPLARDTTGQRILVVADDRDTAEVLCSMLARDGHLARAVHRAAEVLPAALSFTPDTVLLDIGLADDDGLAVARELRRHPGLAALRIYAVSGCGQPADRERSHAAGVDEHLTKPFALDRLRELLRPPGAR